MSTSEHSRKRCKDKVMNLFPPSPTPLPPPSPRSPAQEKLFSSSALYTYHRILAESERADPGWRYKKRLAGKIRFITVEGLYVIEFFLAILAFPFSELIRIMSICMRGQGSVQGIGWACSIGSISRRWKEQSRLLKGSTGYSDPILTTQ